jgi:hypothetical protein
MEVHLATTDWLVNRTGSDEQRLVFDASTGRMVKPSTSTVLGDGGWDTVTDSKSTKRIPTLSGMTWSFRKTEMFLQQRVVAWMEMLLLGLCWSGFDEGEHLITYDEKGVKPENWTAAAIAAPEWLAAADCEKDSFEDLPTAVQLTAMAALVSTRRATEEVPIDATCSAITSPVGAVALNDAMNALAHPFEFTEQPKEIAASPLMIGT